MRVIDIEDVVLAMRNQTQFVLRCEEVFHDKISSACASIFNTLDPEVLAIGGGLCGAGEFLFAPLRKLVDEKCFYKKNHGPVVPAVMGNDAGIVGAAMLRRDADA